MYDASSDGLSLLQAVGDVQIAGGGDLHRRFSIAVSAVCRRKAQRAGGLMQIEPSADHAVHPYAAFLFAGIQGAAQTALGLAVSDLCAPSQAGEDQRWDSDAPQGAQPLDLSFLACFLMGKIIAERVADRCGHGVVFIDGNDQDTRLTQRFLKCNCFHDHPSFYPSL